MIQEVMVVEKNSESIRVPVLLRMDNPRHQLVYNILEKVDNRSAYIREAIVYYHRHHGLAVEEDSLEEMRKVVQECNEQLLIELEKRMERKNLTDYDRLKKMF